MAVKSDIEIAREAKKKPIMEIGARLGIGNEHLLPFGHDKAKVSAEFIKSLASRKDGKLILVTAINPTPAGEGKTTTTVGLGDGLNRIGKKAIVCVREASLGPCFGVKGGAAGGGYAQVVPMEDINLHFTGDFHAVTSAHNLLAAMIDNHIYWGNEENIDLRRVTWRRVMDMNDRALRRIVLGLGGAAEGVPREGGFDITPASEVMAALCLANDADDLRARLGRLLVGLTYDKAPVTAADLKAVGAMTIYRSLRFGKHVELVMTDQRSYRSDHAIPEELTNNQLFFDPRAALPLPIVNTFDQGRTANGGSPPATVLGLPNATHDQLAAAFAGKTKQELEAWAQEHDIPLAPVNDVR